MTVERRVVDRRLLYDYLNGRRDEHDTRDRDGITIRGKICAACIKVAGTIGHKIERELYPHCTGIRETGPPARSNRIVTTRAPTASWA
jgi:hypothetical protein